MKKTFNSVFMCSLSSFVSNDIAFFPRAHWKFLKTVVNKLFEFMHGRLSSALYFW